MPAVRPALAEDAGVIAEIYRPYVERSVASFEDVAPDADTIVARMSAMPLLPWLVAEDAQGVVGYAYASAHRSRAAYRWAVDVSVYVRAESHRRGTGRLLYSELLPILGGLGYFRAYAGITLPNPSSVALHESMGFRPVGVYTDVGFKHGAWHDVGWWQVSLQDATAAAPPPDPKPWRPGTGDAGAVT